MDIKRSLILTFFCVVSFVVSGCYPWHDAPSPRETIPHDAAVGGQTLGEMRAALESIPGVELEALNGGVVPNVKGYTGYSVVFSLEAGYRVSDGPGFVDFVTKSVWSVREGYMPNGLISIAVRSQPPALFDVAAAAAAAGWVPPSEPVAGTEGYSIADIIVYDGSAARERLGDWPGAIPQQPTDVTSTDPER